MRYEQIGVDYLQGRRKAMQDVPFCKEVDGEFLFAGVFDGHGQEGEDVAKISAKKVIEAAELSRGNIKSRADEIGAAFRSINQDLFKDNPGLLGGTTATVAINHYNDLAVVYVGDSEAIFYPDDGDASKLTNPHDTYNQSEINRVQDAGGFIYNERFVDRQAISISRAIGDFDIEFISAKPEIKILNLVGPGTLVLATDGVWGSRGRLRGMVEDIVRDNSQSAQKIAKEIVENGSARTGDNASAVVARIGQ